MNYSELNDYQINNLVHNFIVCGGKYTLVFGEDYDIRWIDNSDGLVVKTSKQSYGTQLKNYCNSWADAGPIIEKHMICLAADVFAQPQDGGKWVAQPAYGWQHERIRHDNPLRAAMIVFLMMQEQK